MQHSLTNYAKGGRTSETARTDMKPLEDCCYFGFEPAVCRLRPRLFARPGVSLSDASEVGTVAPCAASPAIAKWRARGSNGIRMRTVFTVARMLESTINSYQACLSRDL